MDRIARLVALLSVIMTVGITVAAAGFPVRRVEMCLRNGATISINQQAALQAEVRSIWARYGVEIAWRDDRGGIDADTGVLVVNVSDDALAGHGGLAAAPDTLGAVGFSPQRGTFGRTIFVSPRSARWVVTGPAAGAAVEGVLGRVLGRVVAHELGHILLGMSDHAQNGLMKTRFDARDLLATGTTHLELDRRSLDTLAQRPVVLTHGYAADAVASLSQR